MPDHALPTLPLSRESMADFGRVLSEYVDVVVVRTKSHDKLVELAQFCKC